MLFFEANTVTNLRRTTWQPVFFLVTLLLLLAFPSGAQVTTADIVGTVTDPSGASVPGASLVATDVGTGIIAKAVTTEAGTYEFTLLQVGTYRVSVQAAGFKGYSSQVTLAAGDRARVNASLTLGEATETVEVTSTTPALATDTSEIGNLTHKPGNAGSAAQWTQCSQSDYAFPRSYRRPRKRPRERHPAG